MRISELEDVLLSLRTQGKHQTPGTHSKQHCLVPTHESPWQHCPFAGLLQDKDTNHKPIISESKQAQGKLIDVFQIKLSALSSTF